MSQDEFMPTRRSLLSRLKRWDDQESWQKFFDTYGRLIYRFGLKAGLTDAEAQDVVQETIIVVARKIADFNYDPALGSFKSWLLLITRRRIEKQLKKRMPMNAGPAPCASDGAGRTPDRFSAGTRRTATVERVPDPQSFDLEAAWDTEWENRLWEAALSRVKAQVKPKQFQMFDLYVIKEWPVKEVARALGVSAAHIYVNKHRLARLLRKALQTLRSGAFGEEEG
jgi:RNA polymerase sigma-70 factor (ECF subfamily)